MNENPAGTPNPLNPGPAPVQPLPEEPVQPVTEVTTEGLAVETMQPTTEVTTEGIAAETMQPTPEVAPSMPGASQNMTTPMPEPMETPRAEAVAPEQMVAAAASMQFTERPATRRTIEVTENSGTVVAEAEEMVAAEAALGANLATAGSETPEFEPKGSVVEPKKKKSSKAAIIVLAILCLLAAVGCAVAAVVVMKPFSSDAVPAAMAKLMNGAPNIVTLDGTVTTTTNNPLSSASSMQVDFKAGINSAANENYVSAAITATLADSSENFEFSADEIHTSDGNLYLKLHGVSDALRRYMKYTEDIYDDPSEETTTCTVDPTTGDTICLTENNAMNDFIEGYTDALNADTNCISDANGQTNCVTTTPSELEVLESLGLFDVIDGEWILIPDSTFSNATDLVEGNLVEGNNITQCLINAADNLGEYGKDFVSMYKANPFITYSTENIKVAKKKDTIYQLSFDAKALAGFINAMNNSGFMNELNACTGALAISTDVTVTPEALQYIIAMLPEIYVEIDNNDNFTRLYMTSSTTDDPCMYLDDAMETCVSNVAYTTTFTVDISFSYPSSLTIEEPTDYIEINDVLSQVLSSFYDIDITE